jgi:hypothetical protein
MAPAELVCRAHHPAFTRNRAVGATDTIVRRAELRPSGVAMEPKLPAWPKVEKVHSLHPRVFFWEVSLWRPFSRHSQTHRTG